MREVELLCVLLRPGSGPLASATGSELLAFRRHGRRLVAEAPDMNQIGSWNT